MRTTIVCAILLSSTVTIGAAVAAEEAAKASVNNSPATQTVQAEVPSPPQKQPGLTSRNLFLPPAEDPSKPPVVDAPEAIAKARQLHDKAVEKFKSGNVKDAITTEQEAISAAPNYWLPHAGLAYFYVEGKRTFEALKEANISIRGTHELVADRNCARLFQRINWIKPATSQYQKLVKAEPDNWQNYVGLADCYIATGLFKEAAKALGDVPATALQQYDAVEAVGERYLNADQFDKAKELLLQAQTLAKSDAQRTVVNDNLLLCAVRSGDSAFTKEMLPKVSDDFKKVHPDQLLRGQLLVIETPAAADDLMKQAANTQSETIKPDKLFYLLGSILAQKADAAQDPAVRAEWSNKAIEAFKNAAVRNQREIKYQLAIASLSEQLHKSDGVVTALQEIKDSIPVGFQPVTDWATADPSRIQELLADGEKFSFVGAFPVKPKTGKDDNHVYESFAHAAQLQIMKTSCSCHARSMTSAFNQQPGVIFAFTDRADKPTITVVFDTRKQTAKKLFSLQLIANLKDPVEERGEKPLTSVVELSKMMMESESHKAPTALRRAVALELPTETNGQVAGNTPITQ